MTPHEAMQMALDWFHWFQHGTNPNGAHVLQVEEALRTALAQPEPEPLWIRNREGKLELHAPPKKEWVGLTDNEYELMAEKRVTNYFFNTLDYAHAIEAKLKEKNNG